MATLTVPRVPGPSRGWARPALGLALAVLVATLPGGSAARGAYLIEDLGALRERGSSYGMALSSSGVIAGVADQEDGRWRAIVSPGGGRALGLGALSPRGNSFAHGVNAGAQVVGTSDALYNGRLVPRAFTASPFGGMRDLGTLPGGVTSEAFAINDGGTITGASSVGSTGAVHAFRVGGDGQMESLGTLAGGDYSAGHDINAAGAVAGTARTAFGAYRAFIYTDEGGMRSLGTLPTGNATYGTGLNDRGQVVGYGDLGDGSQRAFLWGRDTGLVDLGVPLGGMGSVANAINERSEIVGLYRTRSGESRATLWRPGQGEVLDLNTLLPRDSGWLLSEAMGINDRGQIVGTGLYRGQVRGFLMTPLPSPPPAAVPEPSGLALLALGGGLAGAVGRRRRRARRHGRTN
jgi:probable HAF family extracellular repeat protein